MSRNRKTEHPANFKRNLDIPVTKYSKMNTVWYFEIALYSVTPIMAARSMCTIL